MSLSFNVEQSVFKIKEYSESSKVDKDARQYLKVPGKLVKFISLGSHSSTLYTGGSIRDFQNLAKSIKKT